MDKPRCETCRWWDNEHPLDNRHYYPVCRRFAPRPKLRNSSDQQGKTVGVDVGWPIVEADDWCGEHLPKPEGGE